MAFWILGGVAFLVTCASAPLIRHLLVRHDILDRPNSRSSHQAPTPRGGGIACALGVATAAVAAAATNQAVPWPVLGAALAIGLVGFLDDRFQLPALPRLTAQLVVGAVLGASVGGALWSLIAALLVPLIVNIVNFMDGINGITGLTVALWGGTAAFAGMSYGSRGLAVLGIITAGCAAGFLPWNIPKARLFLGDVGSYLFGTIAAGGVLIAGTSNVPLPILASPLIIYTADVGVTLVRRVAQGSNLLEAHRDHTYQRLITTLPATHLTVSAWIAGLSTLIVIAWAFTPMWVATTVTVVITLGYLLAPHRTPGSPAGRRVPIPTDPSQESNSHG